MPKRKKAKEEEVYHVEVITKARVNYDGEWEYFVKWAGYDSDADSWEPSENVKQCNRLLASFWKHIGMDNKDYPLGYEVTADESWIDKEKRYFAETFVKPSKRKSDKTTRKERRKSNLSESPVEISESSDEAPRVSSGKLGKTRVVDTDSSSGSESDGHSRKQSDARPKATSPPSMAPSNAPVPAKRQAMPPTASSSVPIAPPRPPVVRTHQEQRTNPLVKSMDIPSASVVAGSSLSTKQRIAAGIPLPSTGPKPLQPPPKSLSMLSFKKNKQPVPPSTQTNDHPIPSTSTLTPKSPVAQSTDIADNAEVVVSVASPHPPDADQSDDYFGPILDDGGPLHASPDIPTVPLPPKSQEEINAEAFLKTVDIPELMRPSEMDVAAQRPDQPMTGTSKTLAIPKIPKKWKWSGDLFISTSESKTELLCGVTISEPNGTSNSSHINLLLSSLDSLRISKLYPIMDLPPVLRACGKPQYFGRLEPNESSEEVVLNGLEHHLTNEELAAAIPLLLDGTEVAVLVVFPRALQGLTKFLQVPDHLLSGTPLLVVLLPLLVSMMAATKAVGRRSIGTVQQASQDDLMLHNLPQDAMLHQAMSLLCFPKALLDFLNGSPGKGYCIWPMPDQSSPGLDTVMLQSILKSTKLVPAKLQEDVRFIFISNVHLEMLHTMPTLVTKRVNSPETQFWTYGYSPRITCERWIVQEIYPLGGIVTFTSSALIEDPLGCEQLVSQIKEHPFWDCYLIPEVVAVAHLLSGDGDLSSPSELYLGPILDFINQGIISVIRMPEKTYSDSAPRLSSLLHPPCANQHELLQVYLEILRSQSITEGMTNEQLIAFTKNEICKDLSNAQVQPTFMENYRRFVVIKANSEDVLPYDEDGLEWLTASQLSFGDDFFQS